MNSEKLKDAEAKFMMTYPGGFEHPEMVSIAKKHKIEKMVKLAQDSFEEDDFDDIERTIDNMIKVVSQSSMVSLFEKPKFRDYVRSLDPIQKQNIVGALRTLLHGDEEMGFEGLVNILKNGKLAKWSLVSVFAAYYRPDFDVFMKPTTVKGIIQYLEMDDLKYNPTPSYAFYTTYRQHINDMKQNVDRSLSPSNAAFSGFLMMFLDGIKNVR